MQWLEKWHPIFTTIAFRYFLLAGLAFVLCYWLLKPYISKRKIQQRFPARRDYIREIGYSSLSILILSIVPTILLSPYVVGYTQRYKEIAEYGMVWYVLAFPLMFILHDTYFYWAHRMMHWKKVFPHVHKVHHLSTNPSPWAAFAFHPLEALVEIGIFPILIFTIPLTGYHMLALFGVQMVYNVYGHLGWELFPRKFARHWLGRWINTSVNHNQHHRHFKGNYGLYFLWWDRWMGTIRPDYEDFYEAVSAKRPAK
ncbi:sterol desaturase family protein [Chitinophaga lutea]